MTPEARKLLNLRAAIQALLVSPEHVYLSDATERHLRAASNELQYDADSAGRKP